MRRRCICLCVFTASLLVWPSLLLADASSWFFGSKPQTPHPSVARIIVDESDGVSLGSGTLVDIREPHALVVTNWHVVRDATGPIHVAFPDGFRSAARILRVDRDWDLAALVIWTPNARPVALASSAPHPGEPLTIAGYGSGDYRAVSGKCTQYVAPSQRHPYEMVEVSVAARQGDSGGPIFNAQGELAGVLFGSGGGTTSGSYAGRVGRFLATAWPPTGLDETTPIAGNAPHGRTADPAVADSSPSELRDLPRRTPLIPLPKSKQPPGGPTEFVTAESPAEVGGPALDDGLSWSSLAGPTVFDQIKTVLAAIGAFAIFLQLIRLTGSGSQ